MTDKAKIKELQEELIRIKLAARAYTYWLNCYGSNQMTAQKQAWVQFLKTIK